VFSGQAEGQSGASGQVSVGGQVAFIQEAIDDVVGMSTGADFGGGGVPEEAV